jgi:Ser/Thr protein kinase RdoA (MazF antagonist)
MIIPMPAVWQELTVDNIFKMVEAVVEVPLSSICLRRNSYINRVYELEYLASRERIIIKFYRPGRWTPAMIEEEHAFLKELADREVPVIPPLSIGNKTLFSDGAFNFAIFPKKGGRAMDEFDQDTWQILGRLLAKIHQVGEKHTTSSRLVWEPAVATKKHLEIILQSDYILPDFRPAFTQVTEMFIKKFSPQFAGQKKILLHGDCHKGNLIVRPGEGIFIVDFDDLCLGPAVQDLWMLLPGPVDKSENELNWFLAGYSLFHDFDKKSLALIPALRGMRVIHYVAWLATQFHDPDFHNHFPEAGKPRYWNEIIKDLQEVVYGEES